jgi:hypothetical protein
MKKAHIYATTILSLVAIIPALAAYFQPTPSNQHFNTMAVESPVIQLAPEIITPAETIPEVTITAKPSIAINGKAIHKVMEASKACRLHKLMQGGRPGAETVLACG